MLTMSIIALMSTAGTAFYVRFLVALRRERKSPRYIYGYCVRLDFDEAKTIDPASEPITMLASREPSLVLREAQRTCRTDRIPRDGNSQDQGSIAESGGIER
jgi:hypothetical protein